jgi:hypothetical protein
VIDTLNLVVRQLVRAVLGMPPASVRPADQIAPAGGQTAEYATVKIISCEGMGWPGVTLEPDGHGDFTESLELPERFVASINFYGSSTKDAGGIARYSNEAFDRARRLPHVLLLSTSVGIMQQVGIGFLKASAARNLAGLADATWQGRGQVDLTFDVIARELAPIGTIDTVPLSLTAIGSDGVPQTRTTEVHQ